MYLGCFINYSMDNSDHTSTLLSTIKDLMMKIDCLACHPKNKLLLYHRFVLSKLSWHWTIADLSKTWVIENLDSIVTSCMRKWLELQISATINSLILNKSRPSIYKIYRVLNCYTQFIEVVTLISGLFWLRPAMVPISTMISFQIRNKFSSLSNRITKSELTIPFYLKA